MFLFSFPASDTTTAEPAASDTTTAEPTARDITTAGPPAQDFTTTKPKARDTTTAEPTAQDTTTAEPTGKFEYREPTLKIQQQLNLQCLSVAYLIFTLYYHNIRSPGHDVKVHPSDNQQLHQ
ncbi:chromosomal replication initiator protein DnaA [Plakobranchus ocellatus]|uniref:Chromosomal replication initiator protein DnaA n=1 Tax=Plakobranchus ocellatus TaxID=259542 RepID=A0AAV4B4P0_9GAST|nr:chromosomal replication initiator protein DnaA [Plakobranchus ocellatus]